MEAALREYYIILIGVNQWVMFILSESWHKLVTSTNFTALVLFENKVYY